MFGGEAPGLNGPIERHVANKSALCGQIWEHLGSPACKGAQLLEDFQSPHRKGHWVTPPCFGHPQGSDGLIHIQVGPLCVPYSIRPRKVRASIFSAPVSIIPPSYSYMTFSTSAKVSGSVGAGSCLSGAYRRTLPEGCC